MYPAAEKVWIVSSLVLSLLKCLKTQCESKFLYIIFISMQNALKRGILWLNSTGVGNPGLADKVL